jgi:hypothetical protein
MAGTLTPDGEGAPSSLAGFRFLLIPLDLSPCVADRRQWERMSMVHVDADPVWATEDVDLLVSARGRGGVSWGML